MLHDQHTLSFQGQLCSLAWASLQTEDTAAMLPSVHPILAPNINSSVKDTDADPAADIGSIAS